MGTSLRSKVIRLAHRKPDLRPHLLPLLVKTASVAKPLYGYDSPNNAYEVDDYPYGFRLRTKVRYWVEFRPGKGFRFLTQTLNPKTDRWNKPKASVYSELAGNMYLDEKGHVEYQSLTGYADVKKIREYISDFPKTDAKPIKMLAISNIKYLMAVIRENEKGLTGISINGDPVKAKEGEMARNQQRLEEWEDLLKKL